MKTKLTSNGIYLLFIDEEAEINLADFITDKYNVWKWRDDSSLLGRKKVLAYYPLTKEAKEFDLPLLPNPFEEVNTDIAEKAEKYAWNCKNEFTTKVKVNELVKASTRDFIAGHKAAQSKQFSLEDMKKAFNAGYDLNTWEQLGIPNEERDYLNEYEYIQSLSTQRLPKEFIPDTEFVNEDYEPAGCDFPDRKEVLKTITNSEGKQELVGTYKYR